MANISFSSPIGRISVTARRGEVVRIRIGRDSVAAAQQQRDDAADEQLCEQTKREINEYLDGERREFDLRLCEQGSEFSRRIYRALQTVPYGTTVSYAELAELAGYSRNCARAVGTAMKSNPLPLAVPCHRVVCAAGTAGEYSAGAGTDTKKELLDMEADNAKK